MNGHLFGIHVFVENASRSMNQPPEQTYLDEFITSHCMELGRFAIDSIVELVERRTSAARVSGRPDATLSDIFEELCDPESCLGPDGPQLYARLLRGYNEGILTFRDIVARVILSEFRDNLAANLNDLYIF
jgi:hypothetical protein